MDEKKDTADDVTITLKREQAKLLLDISERVMKSVDMHYPKDERGERTVKEYALHAVIAEQLVNS